MADDSVDVMQSGVQVLSRLVQAVLAVFPNITSTQTTVGAAGGASALPATPLGYLNITLPNGTSVVVPYYTAS